MISVFKQIQLLLYRPFVARVLTFGGFQNEKGKVYTLIISSIVTMVIINQ